MCDQRGGSGVTSQLSIHDRTIENVKAWRKVINQLKGNEEYSSVSINEEKQDEKLTKERRRRAQRQYNENRNVKEKWRR